ncbi:unnamed protein product [Spirodela intermedia]|uniref:Box C/D snoRNA protein 1 n=1 Tax=Spirodela intermedia TaxID=51605 RepID=A0A7I8IRV1_SPIIN|nr:unnamed protein product [Spirodela intermedia]CAA6660584.1 unnamed protein product [Spirodela intermedia]
MEELEVTSSPHSSMPPPCEECGQNAWKYRCPSCSIRTCSLPCVKSHKARTSCTGQRNRTQFVPLSQFSDDLLISDYNLLEETLRVTESARRMRGITGGCPGGMGRHSGFKLRMLGVLRKAAFRRKVRLLLLPAGMSKREKNHSRYDRRTKSIFWTIEWHFHSTDVVLTDRSVDERMNLISVMGKHLKPTPWNHKLRPFCNERIEDLKFFLQKDPKDPKSPCLQLNPAAPMGPQIANITVLEYPVVLVYLPTQSHDFEVEVVKGSLPSSHSEEAADGRRSPEGGGGGDGVFFREEELEELEDDDASGGTRVLDLGAVGSTTPAVGAPGGVDPPPSSSVDGCFDFEQELRDAYSDLIGEVNPDDFLCLDGDFGEGDGVGEAVAMAAYCDGLLEEGEIPDF